MGFNIEFRDLIEFHRKVLGASQGFEDFLKDFLIEMANRIIAKTKPRTPKITGALRNSWKLGDLISDGKNISIEIKNPMEYATDVEYGHRIVRNGAEVGWYEGRFMLKISIDEIRKQMPHRYIKEFNAWCERNGIA